MYEKQIPRFKYGYMINDNENEAVWGCNWRISHRNGQYMDANIKSMSVWWWLYVLSNT